MKLRTEIERYKSSIDINHKTKMLMMGSCFANSIGRRLKSIKFDINLNPFGTLYNPVSIDKSIGLLIDNNAFTENDAFLDKGVYNSFYHHGDFASCSIETYLINVNTRLVEAADRLRVADVLFITFGTAYIYEYLATRQVVSNCHKLPASDFRRYRLSVESIVEMWSKLIERLKLLNPKLQIIFTVSPIRHLRDGAHDSQLSKSILLLAIEALNVRFDTTHYFPSYEILLDDLRDYRFYEQDMVHPSALAIDYIWNFFKNAYLSEESVMIIEEWEKLKKALDHRPYNQDTEEHIHFLKQTLLKLNKFGAKFPYICLSNEQAALESQINK